MTCGGKMLGQFPAVIKNPDIHHKNVSLKQIMNEYRGLWFLTKKQIVK